MLKRWVRNWQNSYCRKVLEIFSPRFTIHRRVAYTCLDTMTNATLRNCTIVVTRPVAQAGKLISKLENLGANVIHFPVITISAADNQQQQLSLVKTLGTYDIAIFISRNAAIYGSELIKQTGDWPPNTHKLLLLVMVQLHNCKPRVCQQILLRVGWPILKTCYQPVR